MAGGDGPGVPRPEVRDADEDALEVQARRWAEPDPAAGPFPTEAAALLDYLAAGRGRPWLGRVVANPQVPDTVRADLAARVSGYTKRHLAWDLLQYGAAGSAWVAMTPALTAAKLRDGLRVLGADPWGPGYRQQADVARRTEILQAFVESPDPAARALAAEAMPLTSSAEHDFAGGELSAPRLSVDPAPGVRVALARNETATSLAEDEAGLVVRQRLLDDPSARVRAAARRHGIALTPSDMNAFMAAFYRANPGLLGVGGGQQPARDPAATAPPGTDHDGEDVEDGHRRPGLGLQVADPLEDPAPRVRATAVRATTLGDDRRWARIAADPSPLVRGSAATWGFIPPWLWPALADDADWRVRARVARARRAPEVLQRRLTGDRDPRVRRAAVEHIRRAGTRDLELDGRRIERVEVDTDAVVIGLDADCELRVEGRLILTARSGTCQIGPDGSGAAAAAEQLTDLAGTVVFEAVVDGLGGLLLSDGADVSVQVPPDPGRETWRAALGATVVVCAAGGEVFVFDRH